MANSPSIVLASLSDEQLKKSIDSLVTHVDEAMKKMVQSTNNAVGEMEAKLKSLGNLKIDSGGSADGGASKRAKAQNEETEAVERTNAARDKQIKKNQEAATSYDQMAAAIQKASRMPSEMRPEKPETRARDSYYAFVQGFKAQGEAIARQIKDAEAALNKAVENRVNELNAKLTNAKAKLNELNVELAKQRMNAERTGNYSTYNAGITRTTQAIEYQMKHIAELQKKISEVSPNMFTQQVQGISALRREQERVANIMKEDVSTRKQSASATQQQLTTEQKLTEEIRKQAAAIRATKEWQEKGIANVNGHVFYDAERVKGTKQHIREIGTLEEQILRSMQQQSVAERTNTQEAQQRLDTIKRIAAEARASMSKYGSSAYLTSYRSESGDAYIYAENDARAKGLTIEQQIANIIRENNALYYDGAKAASMVVEEEKKITQEQEKRKSYKAPVTTINESFKQLTANALGVDTFAIDSTSTKISKMTTYVRQLETAYSNLTIKEQQSPFGKQLREEIQTTSRVIQKFRSEISRPINLQAALQGSEKTLDDIAYKMRRLQSYRSGLDISTQRNEITQVQSEYDRLKKKMDEVMGANQQMIKSNTTLGRSWNYMKNRLAFYVTVGAGTSFIKQLIDIRSQYEMNEKALGILLDSASRGTRIFNELSQMALVSPYTLIELSNAAKQLTAYDIAAKDVVDTTRRLADMASAVGVPVERLTYALGQIKAYGYLNSRDARMFANAGIPLVKQLADRYSELEGKMVSTADVYDRMKKKAIDYNDVMAVINKMTDEGGKFFDFQAKMAETLKVRLANLTLAWNNMLNDMGKDNQGVMTTGLKGLTVMFKHWRELYRVISTAITALGAYKVATIIAGMATKTSIGGSAVTSWFELARGVKSAKDAVALFSLTLKSIPFTAWVTAIATLASYFILFNNSSDDVKQKLEDIKSAFDGVRKEVETLFADAIKTDNIGTQLTKLRDMLELAETELGVTIPIKLEDVNESNVRQKLKEAKQFIDEYINFSQTFSEAAAGTKFNELMNDFGSKARSTYTNVTESINSVVVALQELSDKGQASKRDIEILNELTSGQKEDESRIEYLQRLISLYEELGLIGQKKVEPMIEHNFFKAYFTSTWDNVEELEQKQEENLDRLGIKNKSVFENMLKDVQEYYSSSSIAAYQLEQQVMRVAEKIDINNIPVEQRTMKLTAAINEEASQNNWNQFEKEFARQIANEKFGTTIEISDESKKAAEEDLQAWQRNIQNWAKNNGITFDVSFQTNDTEASYAKRMLQEAKDAKEIWETLGRKEKKGTGSKDATTKAYNEYLEKRKLAAAAGADLSSLDAKNRKAASKAESELAKALKDELSTIDKVRSIYKDLTKEGMSHANAVERATKGWDETVNAINRVLQKNGLSELDLTTFVGVDNPRDLVNILQKQLDKLVARGAKPVEIKELQTKIQTLNVDADKYDLTKITKGLNSELDKLKDEYELAVALDADPELGSIFADWMGVDMSELPKTASEYAEKATSILNKKLGELGSKTELPNLLDITDDDMRAFEENKSFTDKQLELIKKAVEAARGFQRKETEERIKDWDKLLEKYAEYEVKINKIHNDAVKERVTFAQQFGSEEDKSLALNLQTQILAATDPQEKQKLIQQLQELVKSIAGDDKAKVNLITSIDNSEQQGIAKVDFEKFQKSPEWITATGDLAGMTTKAIGYLISSLERYKKTAKNLDPKQIKQINSALRNLHRQQRQGNPFLQIADAIDRAKARAEEFQPEMDAVMSEIISLEKEIGDNDATEEQAKQLETLKKRWKDLAAQGDVSANEVVGAINSSIAAASQAVSMFTDMADALGGQHMTEATQTIKDVTGVLEKAGQGAAIGAQIGGGWGALVGGVAGGLAGLITNFADKWSGNKAITDSVKDSERDVRRLELAYVDLQQAVDKAYGTAVIGAKQATLANKELQLAEIQRQIELEKSRKSKNRDEDRIIELEKQYKELFYEIRNGYTEIVDDLMGTDVGSFAENLVSSMIKAFKQGEDYMQVFSDKFDEMIDNMIMKSIVSRVVSQYLDAIWEDLNHKINDRTKTERDELARAQLNASNVSEWSEDEIRSAIANKRSNGNFFQYLVELNKVTQDDIDNYRRVVAEEERAAQKRLDAASAITDSDVDYIMERVTEVMPELGEKLKNILGEYYKFGESSETQLSALQQGISGITEDTAGALEAITSGMSQQVYYQSTLLEQIRDAIVGADSDIQLGVQGQMLLQLQQSYQVQMSIENILQGVLNPSGRAFSVELLS